jgi:hypothetical protein
MPHQVALDQRAFLEAVHGPAAPGAGRPLLHVIGHEGREEALHEGLLTGGRPQMSDQALQAIRLYGLCPIQKFTVATSPSRFMLDLRTLSGCPCFRLSTNICDGKVCRDEGRQPVDLHA